MAVPEDIQRAFASGAAILTANMRAARWLEREYALEQRGAGRRAWATPAIEDWDTWVRRQWQAHALVDAEAPLLLTRLQERSVWKRIQRDFAASLVSAAGLAALAESAYELLSDYDAQSERKHSWAKTDAERFRQWAASFDRECVRRNWISRAGLEAKVTAILNRNILPGEILLLGFDRTTPAQDSLLRGLDACGVQVRFAAASLPNSKVEFIHAAGECEENATCAWWVRSLIENNPAMRIGVLAPDLGEIRNGIEQVFRRVLMPQTDDVSVAQAMPFEFSLGQPLAQVPVIRAAVLLLRWLRAPLLEEEVSWLLLSGFLSSTESEYLALAKQDASRRESGSLTLEIPLAGFLRQRGAVCQPLMRRLENASRSAVRKRIAAEERLPGRWVDVVQALLRDAGWPGETNRDSVHFQALRRWERALDEIALLDFDGQRIGYRDFLGALDEHLTETIFSVESLAAPVQIMGALESSGQRFDAVWFLSADDASWPKNGRPHPLLPNDVQRHFRMPYSDAESDLELAKAVTARIMASAPVVVFSHADRNKDGELRPSPLLPQNAEWQRAQSAVLLDHQVETLEKIDEASGSIEWPQDRSPGGSEVLKDQAACPFRAFAAKRLRAGELNRNDWGLSAAERGILLHKIFEKIWSPTEGALHSLGDLQSAMREDTLTGILTSVIGDVFAELDPAGDAWMKAYLVSERHRLLIRLEEWMKVEAARVPFNVIACEQELPEVDVGGLKLRLRIDRIDQVRDSECLLIDYKGGKQSPRDWQPPRPNEPQLPLYAVFGNVDDVRGVLFARIRAGDTGFAGSVADVRAQLDANVEANSALAKDPYSDSMRDGWSEALLNLAQDFMRGDAVVDPKEGKKTCRYCAFPGLCRVAELRNPLEEDLEAEENGNGA